MYDWGCCEDGELSILRRKIVDGSFLGNREAFCLDRVYFYHKYRGLVRKVEMGYSSKDIGPIRMIGGWREVIIGALDHV